MTQHVVRTNTLHRNSTTPNRMRPLLSVVQLSESFTEVWSGLAERCNADARVTTPADVATLPRSPVVIVAAGGVEDEAVKVVEEMCANSSRIPIAVAGALADHRIALRLARAGASDYFALPHDVSPLMEWISQQLEQASRQARDHEMPAVAYPSIIGNSPALRAALNLTSRITPHANANVLITGETGTGKELIAHAIHYNGPRANRLLVEVNCAALPAHLVESELFGYDAGAFTDARTAKAGLFEIADGGTLFLDEIGELQIDVQAKLLRALDEGSVRRLGSTRSTRVDVRVIAATHVDLRTAIRERRFREDLFHRLNVFGIHLPPLRDRREDVLVLAEHFLEQLSRRHGIRRPPRLDDATRRLLLQHTWPGNIRELRNAMERALLLGDTSLAVRTPHVERDSTHCGTIPFPADMEAIQQAAARGMVERHRGNKSAAASALGISRKRLYALLHAGPANAVPPLRAEVASPPSFVQEKSRANHAHLGANVHNQLWISPDSGRLPRR